MSGKAVNFFIFCIYSENFRRRLKSKICCGYFASITSSIDDSRRRSKRFNLWLITNYCKYAYTYHFLHSSSHCPASLLLIIFVYINKLLFIGKIQDIPWRIGGISRGDPVWNTKVNKTTIRESGRILEECVSHVTIGHRHSQAVSSYLQYNSE